MTSKIYRELIKQEEYPLRTFKYVNHPRVWIKGIDEQKIQNWMNFDMIFYSNNCEVSLFAECLSLKGYYVEMILIEI